MLLFNYYFELPNVFPPLQFTSIYFLLYLVFVSILLFFIKHHLIRNIFILISSIFFIWTYSQNFYYVIVGCCFCVYGYIASFFIHKFKNKTILLIIEVIPIVALLFFKNIIFNSVSIAVPLGISFYALRLIWYLNYIYNGKIQLQINIINLANYLLFFPSFVSGPIENPKHFIDQIKKDDYSSYPLISKGWMRVLYGVFEKIVICDYFGLLAERLLSNPEVVGCGTLLGIVLYSFQIYLDFDSYSNIAIGAALLFNIKLNENFKSPYLAVNIKDFWSRWHISLSTWLKENIYFPLGGNKHGSIRKGINIILVFIFSGLWHDFAIHYVLWGVAHAILRLVEDIIESKIDKKILNNFFIKLLRIGINYILVIFLWLLFKYDSFSTIYNILSRLFVSSDYLFLELFTNHELLWLGILITFVIFLDIIKNKIDILCFLAHPANILRFAIYLVFIIVFLIFGIYGGSFEPSDFIYRWF